MFSSIVVRSGNEVSNLDPTLTASIHMSQAHCTRKARKLVPFYWYYVGDEHFLSFIKVFFSS